VIFDAVIVVAIIALEENTLAVMLGEYIELANKEPVIVTLPRTSNSLFGFSLFILTREPELYIEPVVSVVGPLNLVT